MLYITKAPYSLLSYYVCESHEDQLDQISFYENADHLQLRNALLEGDFLQSKICVVSLKNEKPPKELLQSQQNVTYLSISTPSASRDWRKLVEEKEWIEELKLTPERYRKIVNQTQIFSEEAEEWFWETFKNYPAKLSMEILNLESRFSTKIPLHFLQAFYSATSIDLFIRLRNTLGKSEATQVIKQLSANDLWTFFIGSKDKAPFIKNAFLNERSNKKEDALLEVPLMCLHQAVATKCIEVRIGAVIFNQWLTEIETKRISGNLKLKYSIEDISRLENYLGL